MKVLVLIASVLLAAAVHAQPGVCTPEWTRKAELDCSLASRQDSTRCLASQAGTASAEMDRLLQVMKKDLVKPADLLAAQHAWEGYRNAECKYQTSGAACEAGQSGAQCSPAAARCQVRLTCERVVLLRDHMGNICADCPPRKSAGQ
jgi:uncharacterized protein YecT (DUF1311 family)